MSIDAKILEIFVAGCMGNPQITELMASWRIDPKEIEEALVLALRDMGVENVPRGQESLIFKAIIGHLKYSPEILTMVRKANRAHALRNNSRHKG